jgi:DNA-directed RNA polymerase subunit beta
LEKSGASIKIKDEKIEKRLKKFKRETGIPMPIRGQANLRDGKTVQPYDQPVTVGVMTMLKLHPG